MRTLFSIAIATSLVALVGCDGNDDTRIGHRFRSSPQLQSFDSCADLHGALKAHYLEETRVQLLHSQDYGRGWLAEDTASPEAGSSGDSGRQEGVDFSGTNNQEAGVDEADFVKTDGYFIYLVNGNRFEILGVPEFGELTKESALELEGWPFQMLMGEDKAVVFSNINVWSLPENHPLRAAVGVSNTEYDYWYPISNITKITVLDIADRAAPSITRELFLEGYYQTARRVESTVRMLTYGHLDIPGLIYYPELPQDYWDYPYDSPEQQAMLQEAVQIAMAKNATTLANSTLADFLPVILQRHGDALTPHAFTQDDCSSFSISEDGTARGLTSILSLDLLGDNFSFDADHIVSNWSVAYASTDTLIVAEPSNDWWWYWNNTQFEDATNIHRFDISQAGETRYTGSGRVSGTLLDQFSISELDDKIRIASTSGAAWWGWWLEEPVEPENHVFVLAGDSKLEVVGHVGGIAIGETIWSSRFDGDKGYLVTFRQIDPLWTIDLSEPTDPKVIGELEVPGVSTYIHPLEGEHLLTVGYSGDENGLDWNTQVCLFDVTDFAAPALDSEVKFAPPPQSGGWSGAWSEANYEHKAFQYWAPAGLLALPVSSYRYLNSGYDYYNYEYKSVLELVSVSLEGGLASYGEIDHSHFFNSDPDYYWSYRDVRRSIFMGDFVYALSDRGVTAHRLDDLSLSASVALLGHNGQSYWDY